MKLKPEQSQKLLRDRGIWITEACDRCTQLLGSVRWTRKDEPGEWCSRACRDGVDTAVSRPTAKTCLECGIPLEGKRADSQFCSGVHRKRFTKSSTAKKVAFIAETPIGKQGLMDVQNGGSTNTLIRRVQGL